MERKLFGEREYLYNLDLEHNATDGVLYKERNFGISVKLVDEEGDRVRNCIPLLI